MKEINKTRIRPLFVVVFFIIFVPSSFNSFVNAVSLYLIIPCLFLYSLLKDPKLILQYKPMLFFFGILLWSALSIGKANNIQLSIDEMKLLLGVFLICYIFVYFSFKNVQYIYMFYFFYVLKLLVLFQFAYTHGLENVEERFSMDQLNANMFGYFGFYAILSAFFIWQYLGKGLFVKSILMSIFWISIVVSIVSCFFAASRAGIVFSLALTASLLLIYFFYPITTKLIYGISLLLILVLLIFPSAKSFYEGSILENRFEISDVRDETRFELFSRAIEIGIENPIFGVGPGNFRNYNIRVLPSHSSYTEIFANSGVMPLFLFLSLIYYFLGRVKLLYSKGGKSRKSSFYFLLFILLFIFYNFFYPFYLQLFLMSYLFIALVHLERLISENNLINGIDGESLGAGI